jgi:ribokinase
MRVVLDPAPAPDALPPELLAVDLLVPNRHEAEQILGRPIEDEEAARAAAAELHRRGAQVAVVKLGARGVVWAGADGVFTQLAPAVSVVDTTGAGDAFAGACAACLDRGMPVAEVIALATRAASLATRRLGAQEALPWRAEVEAFSDTPDA